MTELAEYVTHFQTYCKIAETYSMTAQPCSYHRPQFAAFVKLFKAGVHACVAGPHTTYMYSRSSPCCFWVQRLPGCSFCLLCQATQSWTSCLHIYHGSMGRGGEPWEPRLLALFTPFKAGIAYLCKLGLSVHVQLTTGVGTGV